MKSEPAIAGQAEDAARHRLKSLVFLFPLAALAAFLFLKADSPRAYYLMIREDSIVEDAQALCYLLAAIICLHVSARLLEHRQIAHAILKGMLSALLFFMALEEISWGQRIFGIETWGFFARHNVQYETTFHNLDVVQPLLHTLFSLAGIYGAFAWVFVRRFAPGLGAEDGSILKCLVPEWYVSSYFFLCALMYILLSYLVVLDAEQGLGKLLNSDFFFWLDLEVAELFLALGFLGFVMANHLRYRKLASLTPGAGGQGTACLPFRESPARRIAMRVSLNPVKS